MRRLLRAVPALFVLVAALACSSLNADIKVQTAKDPATDLATLKSYQWAATASILADSTGTWARSGFDLDAELRHDINTELRAKGLDEVISDPDVYIVMLLLGDRTQMDAALSKEGGAADPSIVTEGGLLVELVDAETGRVLWRGGARSTAERVHSDAEVKARVAHAVRMLFEDFPS